ncbi:MAG: aminotransferase class I/II-fold pyridoxal phosphate-dependent enzyme [Rubrivivax sp.]
MRGWWRDELASAAWQEKRNYDGWTNLSSNETRHPELADTWAKALSAIDPRRVNKYAHWPSARRQLARLRGCDEASLAVFAGSDAGLRHIASSIAPGPAMIVAAPNYPVLPPYLAAAGHKPIDVGIGFESGFRESRQLLAAIGQSARPVVWVADPCPCSGACFTAEQVAQIAHAVDAREGLLIWDAAYADFAHSPTAMAARAAGALVVRTLSKGYGCPGIRLASVEGSPDAIEALRRTYGANDLSALACEAAAYCVEHDATFARLRADVIRWREEFRQMLRDAMPRAVVHPGQGNFVLLCMPAEQAREFERRLDQRRILVKVIEATATASSVALRLTVPEPELRSTVLEAAHG